MSQDGRTDLNKKLLPRTKARTLKKFHSKMSNFEKFVFWTQAKGPIFSEKYWYYFHCPKNVLRSILSFVFWIFPPSDTAVQLESADSKHNTISKYLFQDSFQHIFWAMREMQHTFWKKASFRTIRIQIGKNNRDLENPD